MEVLLLKSPSGSLVPMGEESAESLKRVKSGAVVRCDIAVMRNGAFHRKVFSLLQLCYETFSERMDAGIEYRGQLVKPCFDTFREQFLILAGHYTVVFNINGVPRPKAKSMSYANCTPEAFEVIYSSLIDAALKHIYHEEMPERELRNLVDRVLAYA